MSDAESIRIRSYLQSQAARLTPVELVDKVRSDMEQLREALIAVAPDRFEEAPVAGEWNANEVAAHIVTTGDSFARAIEEILSGRPPSETPIDAMADQVDSKSGLEWWNLHSANRERLFRRVLEADPDTYLDQTVHHPLFGDLNWRETLLFLRIHDLDHARQLQAVAASFS